MTGHPVPEAALPTPRSEGGDGGGDGGGASGELAVGARRRHFTPGHEDLPRTHHPDLLTDPLLPTTTAAPATA